MNPLEFKQWLDNCERDARRNGLHDFDILAGFVEKTYSLLIRYRIDLESANIEFRYKIGGLKEGEGYAKR